MKMFWKAALGLQLAVMGFCAAVGFAGYTLRLPYWFTILCLAVVLVSLLAIATAIWSPLPRSQKNLAFLTIPGLALAALLGGLSFSMDQVFGLDAPVAHYRSPSGARSITIKHSCWIDCVNNVYSNRLIFQRYVGPLGGEDLAYVDLEKELRLQWSADEREIQWQVGDRTGVLDLDAPTGSN